MPLSNATTIWEMAYHDAWREWMAQHQEVADIVGSPGYSFAQREIVIGKLGLLQLQMCMVIKAALTMIRQAPYCRTLRENVSGVNAEETVHILEDMNRKVASFTVSLMRRKDFQMEQKFYKDIIRLAAYLAERQVLPPYQRYSMRLIV